MGQSRADSTRGSRSWWRPLMTANANAVALAAPALVATPPATNIFPTSNMRLARFVFGGTRTAADNETINYQVVGWTKYRRPEISKGFFWMPRILAEGTITLGTQQLTAAGADADAAASYIADQVNDGRGLAGTVANNPNDDTIAMLEVATAGCELIELETVLGTAATAWAIYQLGDGPW